MNSSRLITLGRILFTIGGLAGLAGTVAAIALANPNGKLPVLPMTIATAGAAILAVGAAILYITRGGAAETHPQPKPRWLAMALLGLILLGALARLYHLGRESLWRDELATAYRMDAPTLAEALVRNYAADAWITYHIPLYGYRQIVGESEWALRFPSMLAGVLLIPMMAVLGARLFGWREGLIAAALVTLLDTPITYSQEARTYSVYLLFTVLASYFWIKLLEALIKGQPLGRLTFLGYGIASILLIHAHYLGLLLVVLHGLAVVGLSLIRRRWRFDVLFLYAAGAVSFLPWLPLLIGNLSKSGFWPERPTYYLADLYHLIQFFLTDSSAPFAIATMLAGMFFSLWVRPAARDESRMPYPVLFLLAWLVVPFSIIYWRSLEGVSDVSILVTRYLLIMLPPLILLIARAVTRIPVRPTVQVAGVALLIGGMLAEFVFGTQYYSAYQKPRFDPAARYIVQHVDRPDCTFIWGSHYALLPEITYYFRKYGSPMIEDFKGGNTNHIDAVKALLDERNPRYIWFLAQDISYEGSLVEFLKGRYVLIDEQYFDNPNIDILFVGVRVFLFQNPSGGTEDCKLGDTRAN